MIINSRSRLLTYTAVALTSSMAFAGSAQAACVVTANSVTCGTTVTTDTTNSGAASTTAVDRHYPSNTAAGAYTVTVSTGAAVTGYGLSTTNTVPGANTLAIVNNGSVQINAGLLATQGGSAALQVNATGATNVTYTGAGTVTNLGTAGNGILFTMAGSGNLTATPSGSITSSAGVGVDSGTGIGILSTGTNGVYSVTSTGANIRADFAGIGFSGVGATNDSSVTLTNSSAIGSRTTALNTLDHGIYATTAGTGAVSIANTGAIGLATDRTLVSGIWGAITNPISSAALSITGTGAIFTSGTGIMAANAGTGTTTVNYTGAINTTGANGVMVTGTTGATSVTTGAVTGATNGVNVTTTTGTQTIALNGAVVGTSGSGLVSAGTGARTVTVGAAGTVNGGTQAMLFTGTGTVAVTNGGVIGTAATPGASAINSSAAGATTITNSAAGTINGVLTLSANADTFTNSGTWNTQGTTDFGAGTDTLNNTSTGIIDLKANTTFANLEAYTQAGTLRLATFTLTGPAITLTNSGTITTTGSAGLAGFTALTNSGTLTLGAGTFTAPAGTLTNSGTVNAKNGATTITGQSGFTNSKTISLQDGDITDILTINSNYNAAAGATLSIDVSQTGSDRLVINGNVTGVPTNVTITALGTITGINTTGFQIVDVTGTSIANAFTTTSVANGLIGFAIEQRGVDQFVITLPRVAAFSPVIAGNVVMDTWYLGAEAFNAMAQARGGVDKERGPSLWLQPYYAKENYGDKVTTFTTLGTTYALPTRVHANGMGIQGGVDFNAGMAAVGVTGGYQQSEADANAKTNGWNIGAYAMAGGPAGFYGNALAKYDMNEVDYDFGGFAGSGSKADSTSFGVDGEVGFRSAGAIAFDVNAGLAYVNSTIDDFAFSGISYEYDDITSLRGRLGARAIFSQYSRLFAGLKLMHEFDGKTDLALVSTNGTSVGIAGRGTWVRAEVGLGGGVDTPVLVQGWADFGDVKGFGARMGFRF